MDQHIETIVVGGGQAGLSVGYHLKKRGRPFLILDERGRTGDNWRRHWDTLRLYSPARYDGLPGLRFPGLAGRSRRRTRSRTIWRRTPPGSSCRSSMASTSRP